MADIGNAITSGLGIFQQFQAANILSSGASAQAQSIRIGGDIAAQGALLSASGFRQSAESVRQATIFNLELDRINVQRQLQARSRQFQRLIGRQVTQQASTGLAITSKSFLQLRNEASDVFSRAILNTKIDAENTRRAKVFESELKRVNLENQARASEFRARAQRVLDSNRAAEAEFQGALGQFRAQQRAVTAIPTILSQLFQE